MEPFSFEELPMAVTKLYGKMKKIERLLKHNLKLIAEKDELMDIEEAARFLKLSVTTIYSKVCRREMPANKRGKKLYFTKSELKDWIKQGRIKTTPDYNAKADSYLRDNKLGSVTKGRANGAL